MTPREKRLTEQLAFLEEQRDDLRAECRRLADEVRRLRRGVFRPASAGYVTPEEAVGRDGKKGWN